MKLFVSFGQKISKYLFHFVSICFYCLCYAAIGTIAISVAFWRIFIHSCRSTWTAARFWVCQYRNACRFWLIVSTTSSPVSGHRIQARTHSAHFLLLFSPLCCRCLFWACCRKGRRWLLPAVAAPNSGWTSLLWLEIRLACRWSRVTWRGSHRRIGRRYWRWYYRLVSSAFSCGWWFRCNRWSHRGCSNLNRWWGYCWDLRSIDLWSRTVKFCCSPHSHCKSGISESGGCYSHCSRTHSGSIWLSQSAASFLSFHRKGSSSQPTSDPVSWKRSLRLWVWGNRNVLRGQSGSKWYLYRLFWDRNKRSILGRVPAEQECLSRIRALVFSVRRECSRLWDFLSRGRDWRRSWWSCRRGWRRRSCCSTWVWTWWSRWDRGWLGLWDRTWSSWWFKWSPRWVLWSGRVFFCWGIDDGASRWVCFYPASASGRTRSRCCSGRRNLLFTMKI